MKQDQYKSDKEDAVVNTAAEVWIESWWEVKKSFAVDWPVKKMVQQI